MREITYGSLFKEFCDCNPTFAAKIVDYRPWGTMSIVVWLNDNTSYKVKRIAPDRFTVQSVSQDDIAKRFKLN